MVKKSEPAGTHAAGSILINTKLQIQTRSSKSSPHTIRSPISKPLSTRCFPLLQNTKTLLTPNFPKLDARRVIIHCSDTAPHASLLNSMKPSAERDALSEWVSRTRSLLALEWACEENLAVEQLNSSSRQLLERKGVTLANLRISATSTGLYGRRVATLAPVRGKLLRAHSFGVGDVVRLVPNKGPESGDRPPSGIVTTVTEHSVRVAFDEASDDDALQRHVHAEEPVRLDRLPNDAANDKVLQALKALEAVKPGDAAGRIVDVVFRGVEPVQDMTPPVHRAGLINERAGSNVEKAGSNVERVGPDGERVGSDVERVGPDVERAGSNVERAGLNVELAFVNEELNESQREAIAFALRSRDVALIHGPPGTGKTTAVVELIIQAACVLGYKVLVCAPSNVAVDNIAARLAVAEPKIKKKIKKGKSKAVWKEIRMVRLGHPARLLPAVLHFSLDAVISRMDGSEIIRDVKKELDETIKSLRPEGRKKTRVNFKAARAAVKELRKEIRTRERKVVGQVVAGCNVVLATNVGAASARKLSDEVFDLVVIDEAAQAIEASCWLPILYGRRLVLAGDHYQLPPTVKSDAAKDLSVTLFDRVSKLHPSLVRMLDVQYRSNHAIMDFSSKEFYGSKLRSHDSVRERKLILPGATETDDPFTATLIMVDTSGYDLHERVEDDEVASNGSKLNEGEAEIVEEHVKALVDRGLQPSEIAVITPYNGQVHLLRSKMLDTYSTLEIRSVDGFQGREKEVVVLSLVRSNDKGEIGFLADARRLNVAITRARSQVCLICDSSTLSNSNNAFLKRMVDYFEEHSLIRVPSDYLDWCAPSGNPVIVHQLPVSTPPAYKSRINNFLSSDMSSLAFDKRLSSSARREIHELAEEHKLLHASLGEGPERFVVVWKDASAAQADITARFKALLDEKLSNGVDATKAAAECIKYFKEATSKLRSFASPTEQSEQSSSDQQRSSSQKATTHGAAGVNVDQQLREDPGLRKSIAADPSNTRSDVSNDARIGSRKDAPGPNELSPKEAGEQMIADVQGEIAKSRRTATSGAKTVESSLNGGETTSKEEVGSQSGDNSPLADELASVRAMQAERYKSAREAERKRINGESSGRRKQQRNKKTRSKKGKKGMIARQKKPIQKPQVGGIATKETLAERVGGDVDDDMALLNSIVSTQSNCALNGCSKHNRYGDTCQHCKFRFCQEHALPEVHGCGAAAKTEARSTPWISSGGVLTGSSTISAEKRKQLHEKLGRKLGSERDKRKGKVKPKKTA